MRKYIDADILRAYMKTFLTGNDLYTPNGIESFVESLPDADVAEVRHGSWIPGREIGRTYLGDCLLHIEYENYTCSECSWVIDDILYDTYGNSIHKYCPVCGAKMDDRE